MYQTVLLRVIHGKVDVVNTAAFSEILKYGSYLQEVLFELDVVESLKVIFEHQAEFLRAPFLSLVGRSFDVGKTFGIQRIVDLHYFVHRGLDVQDFFSDGFRDF